MINSPKEDIKKLLISIPDIEDKETIELFELINFLNKEGCYLTKELLIKILKWKSARPLRHYEANSEDEVRQITALAFAIKSDKLKIHVLTALNGVSFATASAILMFYDKTKFPVLDIRVWQQLYKVNLVKTNPEGNNFNLNEWETYLSIIRNLASELNITARQVEKRLFDYDRLTRTDNLY